MENTFDYLAPQKTIANVAVELINKYKTILPEILINEWKEKRLVSYLNGLLRSTNPEDYYDFMAEWDSEPLKYHLIFMSVFGDFYYLKEGIIFSQCVHQKLRTNLQSNLRLIIKFSFMKESYQENVLHKSLYQEAVVKLGVPDNYQIFAFYPALSIGGAYELEYVKIVKLKEHLSFLAQLG